MIYRAVQLIHIFSAGGRLRCYKRHWGYLSQKHAVRREGGGSLFRLTAPSTHIWYSSNWIGRSRWCGHRKLSTSPRCSLPSSCTNCSAPRVLRQTLYTWLWFGSCKATIRRERESLKHARLELFPISLGLQWFYRRAIYIKFDMLAGVYIYRIRENRQNQLVGCF